MNPRIKKMLIDADPEGLDTSSCRAAMVRNLGRIPPLETPGAEYHAQRGFDIILFDGSRPVRYCKVRPEQNEELAVENRVLTLLSGRDDTRSSIPASGGVLVDGVRVQVSEFFHGTSLLEILDGAEPDAWSKQVGEVLQLSERLNAAAAIEMGLQASELSLAERVEEWMDGATEVGLGSEEVELISQTLGPVRLNSVAQHGDMWGANVLLRDEGWLVFDYELFGQVDVPLYDSFHLIRTSMPQTGVPWVEAMTGEGPWPPSARGLIAESGSAARR